MTSEAAIRDLPASIALRVLFSVIISHRFNLTGPAMPTLKTVLQKLLPLVSTALFYALYYLLSSLQFGVRIKPAAVPFDFLLQLIVAYILFALSRRLWVFVVLQGLLMGVLYVGNAVKISFFGGPIMPDDVYALRSLLLILEGWHFIAAALPLAAIVALLLFNLTLRHWSAYLASMLVILFGITLVYKPAAPELPRVCTPGSCQTGLPACWPGRHSSAAGLD